MKHFLSIIIFVVVLFSSCKNKSNYDKEVAVIDSTKIVLQVKLNELKRAGQNIESSKFAKFEIYLAFLKSNIKDTLSKTDATAVQVFLNSGEVIKQFSGVQPELVRQTELSINQLQKLSIDAKEGNLRPDAVQAYYSTEKSHAEELIIAIEKNIKALNLSINNYRNSLIKTEDYIKQINNGILPTVVSDTNLN